MRPEDTCLLLIVAPQPMECHATAKAFGLDFLQVARMRFIYRPHSLRGWRRGTPFVARERTAWSTDNGRALDMMLDLLTRTGQLRPANSEDLAEFFMREAAE